MFEPDLKTASQRHMQVYAFYELIFTVVDFAAALLFIIGSILFFKESTTYMATWLFLAGSICFALKPTIRLIREVHFLKLGKAELLADRASE